MENKFPYHFHLPGVILGWVFYTGSQITYCNRTCYLGKPVPTIIDEFLEKFQRGEGGHFRSKKFCCKIFSIGDANLGGSFPFQKIL